MAILKKTLFPENLEKYSVLVQDTDPTSKYFKITELPDTFTGGKNAFLIQGSEFLVADTIVKIEIKDSQGNVIYHEPGEGIPEYYEGTSKVISVYVYPDTTFGPCTITILGELSEYEDANSIRQPIPLQYRDTYNVRWQGVVNVNPFLPNTTKIRFYRRPKIDITEQVLPVFNRIVSQKTLSGLISGVPVQPISGSDYRTYKGILQYELQMGGSDVFSQSMENSTMSINVDGNIYTPTITDVFTDKRAFVNIPYFVTSSLAPSYQSITGFTNKPFTITYEDSETLSNSNVSSSFAVIRISDLESFTGDPARIKVYASSKHDLGDYQLLEDIQIESSEIFLARSFNNQLNVRTGIFTQEILDEFWVADAIDTNPILSVDNSILMKSVRLEPQTDFSSSNGLISFHYKTPLEFSKNTEYQLDFTPLLASSSGYAGLEVYLSGSAFGKTHDEFGKEIFLLDVNQTYGTFPKQQINFKPDMDGTGQVKFVVNGGTWHLSNISLRAAEESFFCPNETTLIADVPTKINNETFDFKFEIYDINNNYVPVTIEKSFLFTGGNDIRIRRDLEVSPAVNQFNFSTSSIFPSSILIDYVKTGLTGSVTFFSQAVDTTGLGITNTDVNSGQNYPGLLNVVDVDTVELTMEAFTGSLSGGKKVGAITYTASCEDINRYFTIYRVEQGAPSYLFYATADKYNFTFDPDDNYKSVIQDDFIDIRLVKQNLPSIQSVGLQIISASEAGSPVPITQIGSIGNATIYRLYATSSTHPSSIDGYSFGLGQSRYDFDLLTVDGHFTSSIIIDAIEKGDKGKGLIATSDANQFFYKMTDLTPAPISQTIKILVKRQNLGSLTNTITVTSGSGTPPLIGPVNEGNGVSSYTIMGGNNLETTKFRYNTGVKTYTFTAYDLNGTAYEDEVTISPVIAESQISVNLTNENATLPARSTGFVASGSFILTSGSVSVKVGTEDILREEGLTTNNRFDIISATGINCTPNDTTPDDATYGITNLTADSGSLNLVVRYKDGRGILTDITKSITYTKAKAATPVVTLIANPQTQTVAATSESIQTGTLSPVSLDALEGSISVFNSATIASSNFTGAGIVGKTLTLGTIPNGIPAASASININYTNSENTTANGTISVSAVKSLAGNIGANGINGTDGDDGSNGINIQINPTTQNIVRSNTATFTPSVPFTVLVTETGSLLTYVSGNPVLNNGQFKITNVFSGSGISNGGNAISNTITPISASTTAPYNTTFNLTYKDSKGNESVAIPLSHSIAITLDGQTGPGVVSTGLWTLGRAYQFSTGSLGEGRRDVVLWSSTGVAPYNTYYGTLRQHTALAGNVTDGAPHQPAQTVWQNLGTQSLFVAAKIGIFEESFVQNTLNIGTNNNGGVSSANITLAGGSSNPYMSIGQSSTMGSQGYGLGGIFLGLDSSVAKLSLVNGTTSFLKWNGTDLEIKGSITVTGGDAATQTYANNVAATAQSNAIAAGQTAANNAAASASAAQLFAQSAANNAVASGSISASVAQTNATNSALAFASGAVQLLASGNWTNPGSTFITSTSISSPIIAGNAGYISSIFKVGQNGITLDGVNKKIYIGTGNYNNTDTGFYVDNDGKFSLKDKLVFDGNNLTVSGIINATGGNFSGNITATGTITGGHIVGATLAGATGTFTGTITGTAGQIGGWIIGPNQINDISGSLRLNSIRPAIEIYSGSGAGQSLVVDISNRETLSSLTTGTSTPNGIPYTTFDSMGDIIEEPTTEPVLTQEDVDVSRNPLFSIGGTLSTFTVPSTDVYNISTTLATNQGTPSGYYFRATGQLEQSGGSPAAIFTYLDAFATIGISIRAGSSTGTEVGNLSVFVDISQTLSSATFNRSATAAQSIAGVLNLTSGVTYHVVPYIRDGYIGALVSNNNIFTSTLTATYRTPQISALTVTKTISKTEVAAGGFQVVASTDRFFIVERNAANTDFVRVGGGLTCTGDVTANTSSDRRWKDKITPIDNPIEKIKKLSGNSFIWKDGFENYHSNKGIDYGVIAQEVEEVMPEIVIDREHGYKGVRYEKIIPLLIEAIKEQQKQIDELKKNK